MEVKVFNNRLSKAIQIFIQKVRRSGLLTDIKDKSYALTRSEQRRMKDNRNIRRKANEKRKHVAFSKYKKKLKKRGKGWER